MKTSFRLTLILLFAVIALPSGWAEENPDVRYGRDVRPILAKHCFKCHGPDPDARESGLRLDLQETATGTAGGFAAIVPGDPDSSEVMLRVTSDDEDARMPPSDAQPPLGEEEIAILRRWIAAGGQYETHWAFIAPRRPPVPDVKDMEWCTGEIDRFVLRRLEDARLRPSGPAERAQLIRRLYLDLTGTTPAPAEVDQFVDDNDPTSYIRLVDRLLASPDYAERFARPWLDLARYSDTNGYEKDRPRSIWPYRDWVINAIAADIPFDQFSIEQLAGDMLADADNDQRIATGFHRNTMMNEEGGIDPLEYRFYAIVDRVATTGTVWMGLTTGCAQCHTHKYDPITHKDYYSLFALLNGADEPDVIVNDAQRETLTRDIKTRIRDEERRLIDKYLPNAKNLRDGNIGDDPIAIAFADWYEKQISQTRRWKWLRPAAVESTMPKLTVLGDDSILASGDVTKRDIYHLTYPLDGGPKNATALRLEVLPHDSLPDGGPGMAFYEGRRGDFFLSEFKVQVDGNPVELIHASHSYGKISIGSGDANASNVLDGEGSTGWSTSDAEGTANQLVVNFAEPIVGKTMRIEMLFERHFAAALGRFRISLTDGSSPVTASTLPASLSELNVDSAQDPLDSDDYFEIQRHFVRTATEFKELRATIEELERSIPETLRTLGMKERSAEDRRVTHRHHRGEYLQPKEPVTEAMPAIFPPLNESQPADRLALARWLVSENNPLVGRVTANRAWREFFGTGIVDTAGDFGTQSEPPSHPELLDWLAVRLRSGDWSMKKLHREIVLSATYRQALGVPPDTDPRNRLVSVFPHRRLDAEQIRDTMLSASGLLTRRVGGPSVHPPQPDSVMNIAYGAPDWPTSVGGDRYRRSLYTFSKRTAPFAALLIFDGPTGELCLARRERSTTPLQALTLLNDAMFMEIAAGLAESAIRESGEVGPEKIAASIFRRLLVREPDPHEIEALVNFYRKVSGREDAWTLVARALMNTDEAITTP